MEFELEFELLEFLLELLELFEFELEFLLELLELEFELEFELFEFLFLFSVISTSFEVCVSEFLFFILSPRRIIICAKGNNIRRKIIFLKSLITAVFYDIIK